MILSSYSFGSLLKEEYQKLEMYARKTEGMYCNIFFPGSAVCRCGKNLYSPPGSEFLTRDIIGVGAPIPLEVSVRRDNQHGPPESDTREPHINTSARMWNEKGDDAFKDSDFHMIKLKKYGFIESEK